MEKTKKELIELLNRNGFYFDMEMINDSIEHNDFDLTQKAYGDSSEKTTQEVFGDDYNKLKKLTKELKVDTPEYVWFD